jgi:hypothetical protein
MAPHPTQPHGSSKIPSNTQAQDAQTPQNANVVELTRYRHSGESRNP